MQSAFEAFVEPAREKRGAWRVLLSLLLTVAVYIIFGMGILILREAMVLPEGQSFDFGRALYMSNERLADPTPLDASLFLLGFAGIWAGLWLSLRLFHRRKFKTLFSPERKLRLKEMRDGFLFGLCIFAISWIISLVINGFEIEKLNLTRTDLPLSVWFIWLLPTIACIFVQAASEELVFRGYLTQQFAALSLKPLVWFVIPTALFALMHYQANLPAIDRWTYIAMTAVMSAVFAALVYKTGSTSAAIGLHVENNILALTGIGLTERPMGMELWQVDADSMRQQLPISVVLMLLATVYVLWRFKPRES